MEGLLWRLLRGPAVEADVDVEERRRRCFMKLRKLRGSGRTSEYCSWAAMSARGDAVGWVLDAGIGAVGCCQSSRIIDCFIHGSWQRQSSADVFPSSSSSYTHSDSACIINS